MSFSHPQMFLADFFFVSQRQSLESHKMNFFYKFWSFASDLWISIAQMKGAKAQTSTFSFAFEFWYLKRYERRMFQEFSKLLLFLFQRIASERKNYSNVNFPSFFFRPWMGWKMLKWVFRRVENSEKIQNFQRGGELREDSDKLSKGWRIAPSFWNKFSNTKNSWITNKLLKAFTFLFHWKLRL